MISRFNPGLSVRYAQARQKVSNRALAKHMQVNPIQVSRWRDADDMRLSRVESLATFFGMTVPEFLELGQEQVAPAEEATDVAVEVSDPPLTFGSAVA